MAKRGPKRNKHQVMRDRRRAASLRKQGKTLREIGKEVGLDEKMVRLDLAFIDSRLLEAAEEDRARDKANQLAKLRWAQIESRDAWLDSRADAQKTTHKAGDKCGVEETVVTEGQSGNPGHMRNYLTAVEKESILLSLLQKEPPGQEELNELERVMAEYLKAARAEHGASQGLPVQPGAVPVSDAVDRQD